MRIVGALGILGIAAINSGFIYYSSILAVGGNGEWGGVERIRFWGFLWILLLTIISLAQYLRGKKSAGFATAILTLPAGYVASIFGIFMTFVLRLATPTSAQMAALCADSGPKFIATPSLPVRSIAYDWGREYPGYFAHLNLHFGYRITSVGYGDPPYSAQVEFIENITAPKHDNASQSVRVVRRDRYGNHQVPVEESAADVTVTYKYLVGQDEVSKMPRSQGLIGYELRVVDNRTHEELATMRYVTDFDRLRACGATDGDLIDVRGFVLRATGIPPQSHSAP